MSKLFAHLRRAATVLRYLISRRNPEGRAVTGREPWDSSEAVAEDRNSTLAPRWARPAGADAGGVGTTTGVVRAFWPPTRPRMRLDVYPSMSAKGRHANSQGGEMSQSTTTSARTPEVVHEAAPTLEKDGTSALITAQEVLFSTRVALLLHKASTPHSSPYRSMSTPPSIG